ncbi:hypothetical protein IZU89_08595 [Cellulophaga lytica]|uniref:hypothetical protein n=1 Tax=Cellulophaga lytica TaxID=979 RepID=UPI0032E4064C
MLKKAIIVIFILCCNINQKDFINYDRCVWNGMLAYKREDFSKSLKFFQKAFEIIPDENPSDYFYAAAAALKLKQNTVAEELIVNSILNTNASKDYFNSFSEFNEFRKTKTLQDIEKKYDSLKELFLNKSNNRFLNDELNKLRAKDQKVRKKGDKTLMRYTDSININRLINITKEYGWQKKGWIILWHQRGTYEDDDNYVWKYFKPYINEQIREGKIRKDFWAIFEEEISILSKKKQLYGFYFRQFKSFPIIDIEGVDERRKKIGRPPLWYLNEVYGVELPETYKTNNSKTIPLD